jgi:hypothetical protein
MITFVMASWAVVPGANAIPTGSIGRRSEEVEG